MKKIVNDFFNKSKKVGNKMLIIYYGNELDKRDKMLKIVHAMQIPYLEIGDDVLQWPMKDICFSSKNLEGSHSMFLYFIEENHQTVLELEKQLGFSVSNKAMRNKNNENWKLIDLMEEIEEEANYFKKREYLYELVQNADFERMEKDEEYAQLVSASYGLFQQDEVPLEILEFAIDLMKKSSQPE